MDPSKILILGGYGTAGRAVSELLLRVTDAPVGIVIAGRRLDKCQDFTRRLASQFGNERVESRYADAADRASLIHAFTGANIVVVTSSTSRYTRQVAEAAISAGIDYFDIIYSTGKLAELSSLTERIERSGLYFITDGGFHPGLPAALVRYVALRFDSLHSARVGSVIRVDWASLDLSPTTIEDFVAEFADFQSLTYVDGRWRKAGTGYFLRPIRMNFGAELGNQPCYPMHLAEMQPLPEMIPGLQQTGFFVGGFGWLVDLLVTPIVAGVLKVAPRRGIRPMARLMGWSLRAFSRPPYVSALKVEARGLRDGSPHTEEILVAADDAYVLTAAPVAACLLQYLDGSIRKPGLRLQAHAVDPSRLLSDMETMGIEVRDEGRFTTGKELTELTMP